MPHYTTGHIYVHNYGVGTHTHTHTSQTKAISRKASHALATGQHVPDLIKFLQTNVKLKITGKLPSGRFKNAKQDYKWVILIEPLDPLSNLDVTHL